ncbi:type II secretion system protein N [Alteromonas pelagimontana]|uniref:Type II secretion system protein N n=1 Tax=Alteromonas pelagimontana TaxID=1858656 RepID=A0A6M4MCH4_9ALTE|nr:type II secretion system protein N [Alteromonas pelagimontana]QJR80822.1 type II secretion system protein N [Alteromonas pelagimontana]
MKFRLGWIAAGILIFLTFLIAYLPANQIVGRLTLPENVQMYGVSGTIWNGKAQQVLVQGIEVSNVSWDVQPLHLLVGELAAHVRGGNLRQADTVAFEGPVSVNLFNTDKIEADGFLLFLPVDRVLSQVPLPLPVNAGGRFRVRLEELEYGPDCSRLIGTGDWLNATVAGTQGPIDFGSYSAKLRCEGNGIGVTVEEPNMLGLSMDATVSAGFENFSVSGQFKPDDSLPEEVHQAAQFFGKPNASGYIRFEL